MIKTSYSLLKEFCKIRNSWNCFGGSKNPITERVQFINNFLNENNITYTNRVIDASTFEESTLDSSANKFCNIEINFNQHLDNKQRLILVAHHDIVNLNSDNMNDNSASVCELLNLCLWLKNKNNLCVSIIILDIEESGMYGSAYLSKQINSGFYGKSPKVLNLELCGFGDRIHIENIKSSDLLKDLVNFDSSIICWSVPANDSFRLRAYGIDSICIGILPQYEIDNRNNLGSAKCWSKIHTTKDLFSDANDIDMRNFNRFLRKFIYETC